MLFLWQRELHSRPALLHEQCSVLHFPVNEHMVMPCPLVIDTAFACVRIGYEDFQAPWSSFKKAMSLSRMPARHMLARSTLLGIICNEEAFMLGWMTPSLVASLYIPDSVT